MFDAILEMFFSGSLLFFFGFLCLLHTLFLVMLYRDDRVELRGLTKSSVIVAVVLMICSGGTLSCIFLFARSSMLIFEHGFTHIFNLRDHWKRGSGLVAAITLIMTILFVVLIVLFAVSFSSLLGFAIFGPPSDNTFEFVVRCVFPFLSLYIMISLLTKYFFLQAVVGMLHSLWKDPRIKQYYMYVFVSILVAMLTTVGIPLLVALWILGAIFVLVRSIELVSSFGLSHICNYQLHWKMYGGDNFLWFLLLSCNLLVDGLVCFLLYVVLS